MAIITTEKLNKEYSARSFSKQKIHALKDFSFDVKEGEIFGLLGPNGAGKTTLIKILLGITFPTSGKAEIFGRTIKDESYKKRIGYLPESHKFPGYLTGEGVLLYFGRLSGLPEAQLRLKVDEFLTLVDLEGSRKMKVKKYSKGMLQRLGLAQSMLNDPDLIFLDEPTDGVDPVGRKQIRDILLSLKARGKTIFLNSHILLEVEAICDRVAILDKGDLKKEGTVDDITSSANHYKFTVSEMNSDMINKLMNEHKAVLHGSAEFIYTAESVEELNKIIDILRSNNVLIHSVLQDRKSLESEFINLINSQNNN